MSDERKALSHKLVHEWVKDRLEDGRSRPVIIESEWVGEGIPFPEDTETPDRVHVYVTVPANFDEERIQQLAEYLRSEAGADPRFAGRFASARFEEFRDKETERVDSSDVGPEAQKLTFYFVVKGPSASSQSP